MPDPRKALDLLPRPVARGLRWAWRRIPPRDARFLLQDLETEAKREALLRSPHYARFARREAEHWSGWIGGASEGGGGKGEEGNAPSPRPKNTSEHPLVRAETALRASPDPATAPDPWRWLAREFPGRARAAVLGAGDGSHCRMLVDLGIAREVVAVDLAGPLASAAQARFDLEGYPIRYRAGDLNFEPFEPGAFDLCLAFQAVHHVIRLEDLFARAAAALAPGGALVLHEYVGPRFVEHPPSVRRAANAWMARLPERYRRAPGGGPPMRALAWPDRWQVQRDSPFESIRSDRILPALRESFEIQVERHIGGGLVMALLGPLIGNFDPADEEGIARIREILADDARMTAAGEIPNYFAFIVARPRAKRSGGHG